MNMKKPGGPKQLSLFDDMSATSKADFQGEKKLTKRDKALNEYKAYVDSLTDELREKFKDLISINPDNPSLQLHRLSQAIAKAQKTDKDADSILTNATGSVIDKTKSENKEGIDGSIRRNAKNLSDGEENGQLQTDGGGRRASGLPGSEDQSGIREKTVPAGNGYAGGHGRGVGYTRDAELASEDYTISPEDRLGQGGPKQKFRDNIAAIRLLSELKERRATPQEQAVLVRYVGWGGLPQAFTRPDGTIAKGWESEVSELKELLSPDDYAAARSTTQDAHYTSQAVVGGIYDALMHFGVKGGKFLEPAAGTGNFIGLMPQSLKSRSKFTAVEIDPTSAAIARHLYPKQTTVNSGFQDLTIAPGSFDVAIGNPPFGSKSLFDPNNLDLRNFSIHNYFFAKSIKALRPNGILAMVVSSSMMDKHGAAQREWISERAEMVGAIRMPNTAFRENALTDVTTDLIFLRKREENEEIKGHKWQGLVEIIGKDGVRYRINEYFADNPHMMLGDVGPNKLLQAEVIDGVYDAVPGLNGILDAEKLKTAIGRLPADIYKVGKTIEQVQRADIVVSDVGFAQPFGYALDDNGQAVRRLPDINGEMIFEPVMYAEKPISGMRLERFKGVLEIRECVRLLMRAEIDDTPNMEFLRQRLNRTYDGFVKKYGYVCSQANADIFKDDPTDYPLLRSLEVNYNKGISKAESSRTGEAQTPPSADKAAIFTVRTREPYRAVTRAESPKDALAIVMREHGVADIEKIAALVGKSEDAVAQELSGLLFLNPKTQCWETAETYLSGNVKKKLHEAREAAMQDRRFIDNAKYLENVQPEQVPADKIFFQIGATWIPVQIYEQFAREVLLSNTKISYNANVNVWGVEGDSRVTTPFQTDHKSAVDIYRDLIRSKDVIVWSSTPDGKRFVDMEATTQARAKADEMNRAFRTWATDQVDRRDVLEREFNEKVNTHVEMKADGSHMIFPGMGVIKSGVKRDNQLEPHQKNAVWRMVQQGGGLLDHVVGSGKTFVAISVGMEMKRMGLIKKPIYAVPNHLVQQWSIEFQKLYPGANVLMIGKKDFAKAKRQEFLGRIATGAWDAVLMAHSSFGFIRAPREYEMRFYKEQLYDYKAAISEMISEEGKKSRSVKQMESASDRLEEKLKAFASKPKDAVVDFAELGVDALFVDEAHEFKNLYYATSRTRVAGLGNPIGSKKAFDMFVKTQFIQEQNNGRGVFFLTGTPVSNSIAEMYTMMRYLRNDRLKEMGIRHFDQWANMFARTTTDWEVDPSGTRYRLQSKLEFANIPGLMAFYKDFADIISTADLKKMARDRGKVWPIPDIMGEKPANVVAERSDIQQNFMEWIVYRFDHMPKDPRIDNPLKATGDAMKGALDIRLIRPDLPDFEDSKVNLALRNIIDIHSRWTDRKGTQLVFCDLSVPKGASSGLRAEILSLREAIKNIEAELSKTDANDLDRTMQVEQEYINLTEKLEKYSPSELMSADSSFSVYDDIKVKLMVSGIPASEIAFIHDANTDLQKEQLFDKVRSGRVRVLIGSTSKMGAGMNVQDRLVALHNLDAPWRPADLEQREGRIIRQGNLFYNEAIRTGQKFEVEIYRYATNQTLDTRRWQVIERKAVSIASLRAGGHDWGAIIEDTMGEATNAAEMKAASSGNPLILEEIKLRQEINKVEALQNGSRSQRFAMERKIKEAESFLKTYDQTVKDYWANKEFIEAHPKDRSPQGWEIAIDERVFKASGLVPVPDKIESEDKGKVKANKDSIKRAQEHNDSALKTAKEQYAKALRENDKIEFINYRGVDFHIVQTYSGTVIEPDLKSIDRYEFTMQSITASNSEGISPDGLIVRLDNYLDKIARSAEAMTAFRAERRDKLIKSQESAKKQLAEKEDFEPKLRELYAKHASVLKALKDSNANSMAVKPDMSMWVGGAVYKNTPRVENIKVVKRPGSANLSDDKNVELSAFNPQSKACPQNFCGKITRVAKDYIYQEGNDGRLVKHVRGMFNGEPAIGDHYKVIYRRGVGCVEGRITPEESTKLAKKRGRKI